MFTYDGTARREISQLEPEAKKDIKRLLENQTANPMKIFVRFFLL